MQSQFYNSRFYGVFVFLCCSISSFAQLQLPQPSPRSSVLQVVGLNEIKVDYSSPSVKGRKIWGAVVPYGEIWRSGANRPTRITFSEDVIIGDKTVTKGSYTIITLPNENEWSVMLNTDSKGNGAFSYLPEDDVVKFTVTPEKSQEFFERLAYTISADDNVTGTISLRWENMKVSFKVQSDVNSKAKQNITASLSRVWYDYALAAEFYLQNNLDMNEAMKLVDNSINLQEHFFNRWVKAQIYASFNNSSDALKYAKEAQMIGEKVNDNFYKSRKEEIEKAIAKWSN